MAELARIARPWLLASRQQPLRIASPYLSLRSIGTTPARASSQQGMLGGRKQKQDTVVMNDDTTAFLLPYTIVPPPIRRFPLSPVSFCKMVWLVGRNRVVALGSLIGVYFVSMRMNGFGWPLFRANRRSCIPTAKALHVQMSDAVARGDKEALRRVCSMGLFQTLAGAIDARPPGVRTEWELVRYDDKLQFPRLADFRVSYQPQPMGKGMRLVKQAVVGISSVQRLTRYADKAGGAVVPGSGRERHMTEYIVLQATVPDDTFEAEPFKIWGTLSEMSYETMRDDAALFASNLDSPKKAVK
ncbi:hypothetical protein ANO14919_109170 [Xylariales sp. No.14919]|nr:hypothetical protein ANO14919_109170 [Xylariales sp. No.14919]